MPTLTYILLPEIISYFDSALLSKPMPKFCDDSETILKIYEWLQRKYLPKCKNMPERLEKFYKLEREFLELYERAKKKEEDLKAKTGDTSKEPFSYIYLSDRRHQRVFSHAKSTSNRFKFK